MRGISLLETIFAGLLLSVTFFVILSLYPSSQLGLRQAHQVTRASELAQSLLEARRAAAFDELANLAGVADLEGLKLAYEVQVENSPDGTDGVKQVAVNVSWQDGSIQRSLARESRIARWSRP